MKQQRVKAHLPKAPVQKKPALTKHTFMYALLCAIGAFLLYVNTVKFDYVLDDEAVITKNEFVQQGIKGIPSILSVDMWHFQNYSFGYYRPLSLITFAIEQQISPQNPHLSHFINVLLYSLSCFVLCLVLLKVFSNINPIFSIITCLIFAAHPLHTEVVANIKSRDEILAFLNMLLSIYFILKMWESGKSTLKTLILPCVFFYLALISKETAQVEIILVPLILFFKSSGNFRRITAVIVPLLFILAAFQLQKYLLLGTLLGNKDSDLVSFPYAGTGLGVPTIFTIFSYGLRLMLVPHPLAYNYALNQIPAAHYTDISTMAGIILFTGGCFIAYRYYRIKSPIGLGIAIWFGMLIPGMMFTLLKGGVFAERLLFIPVLGFAITLAWLLLKLSGVSTDTKADSFAVIKNWKLMVPVALILLPYSAKTISRNAVWVDNLTLFSNDLQVASNSCQVHYHYGAKLIDMGIASQDTIEKRNYFNKSMKEMDEAIRINPKYGEAYFDKGYAFQSLHYNFDSIVYYYNKTIELTPGIVQVYNNMGMLYANIGIHNIASYYFNKAVEVNPFFTEGIRNHERHVRETGFDVKVLPPAAFK